MWPDRGPAAVGWGLALTIDDSMNYRSVLVFGVAEPVDDPEEKARVLRGLSEHLVPGRWADVRGPAPGELKATSVLSLPIDEASAKVRTGPSTTRTII